MDTDERLDESTGFEIVRAAQTDVASAVDRFRANDDSAFGDATIAASMKRVGVEYRYGFDDEFDAIDGVTRLATATHPYE